MAKNQQSQSDLSILVLGTGGTIAGLGGDAYLAAQLPIDTLIPATSSNVFTEQMTQIDSKDMSFEVWVQLTERLQADMQVDTFDAVVITHGTDTMEETAYFLHRTLTPTKPIILTGAMRPADSIESDGPGNMQAALRLAASLPKGVWVVFAGQTFAGGAVQKIHPNRLDAFAALPAWDAAPIYSPRLTLPASNVGWPCVDVVMNYAGADGKSVLALIDQRVGGIVVAGTGNGTLSTALEAALETASAAGILIGLTTRCLAGRVVPSSAHRWQVFPLPAAQARIELILQLLSQTHANKKSAL